MSSSSPAYSVDSSDGVNVDDFLKSQGITLDDDQISNPTPSKLDLDNLSPSSSPDSPLNRGKKAPPGGAFSPSRGLAASSSPRRPPPSSPSSTRPPSASPFSGDVSLTDTTATQDDVGGVMDGLYDDGLGPGGEGAEDYEDSDVGVRVREIVGEEHHGGGGGA